MSILEGVLGLKAGDFCKTTIALLMLHADVACRQPQGYAWWLSPADLPMKSAMHGNLPMGIGTCSSHNCEVHVL